MSYGLRLLTIAALGGLAVLSCGSQAASVTPPRVVEGSLVAAAATPEAPSVASQEPGLPTAIPARETPPPTPTASPVSAASSVAFDSTRTSSAGTGNRVDDVARSFTLPSASGRTHSLDSHLGEKNVVLVFYRAFW